MAGGGRRKRGLYKKLRSGRPKKYGEGLGEWFRAEKSLICPELNSRFKERERANGVPSSNWVKGTKSSKTVFLPEKYKNFVFRERMEVKEYGIIIMYLL